MATHLLEDPNFERTVVVVLEHNDEGALGVVLNRPSALALDDALPEWAPLAPAPAAVFVGGPVAKGAVIAIARLKRFEEHTLPEGTWNPIVAGVGVLDLGVEAGAVEPALDALRVFTGYAGWGSGQLEAEIAEGAWWVVQADVDDALTPQPAALWRTVLRRQRSPLNRFALYPHDVGSN
ncbi:MAG: YqgE/AlgH family protein [Acidimicrobiales bacterium]